MTNIEAGSQRIRRLPDKPIVGETYPNAGGLYKVDRYDAECDLAWVHRPKDGWKCCAHGPALYDVPGRGINRPIYPIAFIKYKMAIGISPAVCCFSTAGRKKIHDMLEVDMTLFSGLREHLPDAHSMEYADCRLSLLAVQKGVCSISGEKFVTATEIACHLKTPKEYGGLERYSNLVLIHKKYVPLLQIGDAKSLRDICRLLKVTKKQLTKINTLRKAAKLAAI